MPPGHLRCAPSSPRVSRTKSLSTSNGGSMTTMPRRSAGGTYALRAVQPSIGTTRIRRSRPRFRLSAAAALGSSSQATRRSPARSHARAAEATAKGWFADEILPRAYGYPMKIRVPTKLGFKNPKYVISMEVTNDYKGGYWEDQGYNSFSGS